MLKKSAPAMLAAIALSFGILFGISGAQAAELKVLASGAMSHALQEISEDFAKQNGHTLAFTAGTTGVLQDKARAGEKADIIVVTSAGMDGLGKEKLVVPGTLVELARALVGIAVCDRAAQPHIATPDT